jgi:hypothetical protein
MHYKTEKTDFPITSEEPFLATQKNVVRDAGPTLEVTQATLPVQRTVIVLEHSL